jgi:hypothetical protein
MGVSLPEENPQVTRETPKVNARDRRTAPQNEPPKDKAELQQLADALTQRGYDATIITPAPYLAIHVPGATLPQLIYSTSGQFRWNSTQDIAPTSQTPLAADIITWALRNTSATHDATSPLATTPPHPGGGWQQC